MDKAKLCNDLVAEAESVHALLAGRGDDFFACATSFKDWTVHDVMAHLHYSDHLALLAASKPDQFKVELGTIMQAMGSGKSLIEHTRDWLTDDMIGAAILSYWRSTFDEMVQMFRDADDDARYDWFGPPMGVAMFATARQMETWAHGLSLFDIAGEVRADTDRIINIVVIGCKTYGWTFKNRGEQVPGPMPKLSLTLPSGALFEDGEGPDSITGAAVDFAKVVTQTRNIADVSLTVIGDTAVKWMEVAQCFAGPPEQPPLPGTRTRSG